MDGGPSQCCDFCKTASKKYTCPRCNADYCSLICFQSSAHLQCSESFYQTCVMDNLCPNAEDKDKMLEVLKRFYEQHNEDDNLDSDDDDEGLSLAERLVNVDLDDTKEVWNRLSSDERQEFEAFLRSEEVTKFLPKWQPWWMTKPPKIREMDYEDKFPKIFEDIKEFYTLTSKPPAECVRFNVANVVAAYVFTARYFNGDYFDFVKEAVGCIARLSLVLECNQNFESVTEAVQSVQERSLKNEWIMVDGENITAMKEDVNIILEEGYCLYALSDLHRLLTKSLSDSGAKDNFMQHCPVYNFSKKDIKLFLKKIEYFLSYTVHMESNKVILPS
ncbi:hypothetical protein FQR65_LT13490 [Abscondita terminalis]|nr:hypothetical protein FQR65_LT13490 [Abscondita terminalis]